MCYLWWCWCDNLLQNCQLTEWNVCLLWGSKRNDLQQPKWECQIYVKKKWLNILKWFCFSFDYSLDFYLDYTKCWYIFVKWNSSAAFAVVVKVTNHTRLGDVELTWYYPSATHWIGRGREGDKPHWNERCWARLILSECFSLDLPKSWNDEPHWRMRYRALWLGERLWKPRF